MSPATARTYGEAAEQRANREDCIGVLYQNKDLDVGFTFEGDYFIRFANDDPNVSAPVSPLPC